MDTNNDFKDTSLNLSYVQDVISELGRVVPEFGKIFPVSSALSAFTEPSSEIEQVYSIGSLISADDILRIGTEPFDLCSQSDSYAVLPEETLDTVRKLEPLVPKEEQKEFEEILAPPKDGKAKTLTLRAFITLVGIILQIICVLQNNTSGIQDQTAIEQRDKQIELLEEELALEHRKVDVLEQSCDLFQAFYNALEIPDEASVEFNEQVNVFDDPVDTSDQNSIPNTQYDNDDALGDVQNLQK